MQYLITGGRGFIGTHLNKYLTNLGHKVSIFHRQSDWSLADFIFDKPDVIIHLAAYVRNTNEQKHINDITMTNQVCGYVNAYSPKTKVLFASTCNVYKSPTIDLCREGFYKEPRTLYEHSKVVGEHIVKQCADHGILRLSNVYGPGMKAGVMKDWLTKTEVVIRDKAPYSYRCFVHIDTIVDAFYKLSLTEAGHNATYNVCGKEYTSLEQLAAYMQLPFRSTEEVESTILLPSGQSIKNALDVEDNHSVALEVYKMRFPGARP